MVSSELARNFPLISNRRTHITHLNTHVYCTYKMLFAADHNQICGILHIYNSFSFPSFSVIWLVNGNENGIWHMVVGLYVRVWVFVEHVVVCDTIEIAINAYTINADRHCGIFDPSYFITLHRIPTVHNV